jgi:hypothetical protein
MEDGGCKVTNPHIIKVAVKSPCIRVEVPITDHLRDFVPNLEKHKVVQILV